MAISKAENFDAVVDKQVRQVGRTWQILDSLVDGRMVQDSMDSMKISLKVRPGGYLLIVEGMISGIKKIAFRDLASLTEAGSVLKAVLEEPNWRDSKPFVTSTKLGT